MTGWRGRARADAAALTIGLVVGARRRLNDRDRVGARECLFQSALEPLVKQPLAPLIALPAPSLVLGGIGFKLHVAGLQ